jgi:PAS domain S-box-containing protein
MTDFPDAEPTALREVDLAFDRVFRVGPLAIATVNRALTILRVNDRLCELLGYSADELVGRKFSDLTHPDDVALTVDLAQRALDHEFPYYSIEKRYIRKSGEPVRVKVTATLVRDDSDDPVCGLALIEDVTERREAEERIRSLNAQLEERVADLEGSFADLETANKELEAFSSTVSHDLKGPLVTVAQFSQILLNRELGPLNEAQEGLVARIRTAGLQAKHIIDDLRDLADVTRREIFAEEVDLSAMARRIIEDLHALVPERRVRFDVRDDLRAYGDPALVRLLLVNILQNAWKYTGPRELAHIEMSAEEGPIRTVYSIQDNGIGFENDKSELIFEAFERLHTEAEFAGTGLGLATAKRIVRRHGGEIWASGTPDRGATFSFTL